MTWSTKILLALVLMAAGGLALLRFSDRAEFLLGGFLVTLGDHLQDRVEDFDFQHHEATPDQVWTQFLEMNRTAAAVQGRFPRTTHHPVMAMVTCMDGRLDTNEIAGDTRHYYYVLRFAGSVLSEAEMEMLELAVTNGVKVVVFTTHTDCGAERLAADPARRRRFPHLARAVDERGARFHEFLGRPLIKKELAERKLLVKWMDLDTRTERLSPHQEKSTAR